MSSRFSPPIFSWTLSHQAFPPSLHQNDSCHCQHYLLNVKPNDRFSILLVFDPMVAFDTADRLYETLFSLGFQNVTPPWFSSDFTGNSSSVFCSRFPSSVWHLGSLATQLETLQNQSDLTSLYPLLPQSSFSILLDVQGKLGVFLNSPFSFTPHIQSISNTVHSIFQNYSESDHFSPSPLLSLSSKSACLKPSQAFYIAHSESQSP